MGKQGAEFFHSARVEEEGGRLTACPIEDGAGPLIIVHFLLPQILNQFNSRERQMRNGNIYEGGPPQMELSSEGWPHVVQAFPAR